MRKVYIKKITLPEIKQKKKLNLQGLKLLASQILKEEKAPLNAEVSVTLVDNAYIKKLNAKYRKKNTPTDVIAFALSIPEKSFPRQGGASFLGDIYISVEQADSQVQNGTSRCGGEGETLQIELKRLLIHGVLHILGYKHSKKMKAQEEYYLKYQITKVVSRKL